MKKNVLFAAALLFAGSAVAQDLTSKKGENYLPEAGDIAISLDAVPFLNYVGGFFSNAGATSPGLNPVSGLPWHIRGKYFLDEKTAVRAGLRIGIGSDKVVAQTGQFTATPPTLTYPNLPTLVEDELKMGATNVVLSGGLEMRRGNTRLQGYYGGELFIIIDNTKDAYTYGNANETTGGALALSTDFSTSTGYNNVGVDPFYGNDARITEMKTSSFGFGLRGFIGVEYFLFPKISIAAEYGWGLGMGSSKESTIYEGTDGTALGTITDETADKYSSFGFDTDINYAPSGQLNIIFHF